MNDLWLIKLLVYFYIPFAKANVTTIKLIAWKDNGPYYIHENRHHVHTDKGLIPQMIKSLDKICDNMDSVKMIDTDVIHDHKELMDVIFVADSETLLGKYNISRDFNETVIFAATTIPSMNHINSNLTPITLMMSPGAAVIVREESILQIKKFFIAIRNSMIIIYLGLVLSIIVGAIIWLFEHKINPGFPQSFGPGLWTGFWFSFVTMTTVGYGDKIAKHVMSRLVSILWTVFGVVLTTCITVTVMDEMRKGIDLTNEDIAVLNDTNVLFVDEQLGGHIIIKKNYKQIIESLQAFEVKAGLVDANTAAYLFHTQTLRGLAVERLLTFEAPVNLFFLNDNNKDTEGVLTCLRYHQDLLVEGIKSQFITPLNVNPHILVSMSKIFDSSNDALVYYSTIIALLLICIAIITESIKKFKTICNKKTCRNKKENSEGRQPILIQHENLKQQVKRFKNILEELEKELDDKDAE